jgi:hypothetical protein
LVEKVAAAPTTKPTGPILSDARKSWSAWKGLWRRSTLEERRTHTQALLRGWLGLGHFVRHTKQSLSTTQRKVFLSRLAQVDRCREELPHLLGEPGETGYRIAILARDEDPVSAFERMGVDERQLLAQDWKTSALLLRSHLQFLEGELGELNRAGVVARWLRALRSFLNQRAGWCVAALLASTAAALWVIFHR